MRAKVRRIKAKRKSVATEAAMDNAEDLQNYVRGMLVQYGLKKPEAAEADTPAPKPLRLYRNGKPDEA